MSTAIASPASSPLASTGVAPIVSNKAMRDLALLKLQTSVYTIEQCQADLVKFADAPAVKVSRVLIRKTPKGTVWMSLGYKASPGAAASCTLPKHGWEAIVKLVQDGTIAGLLRDWDSIQHSSKCESSSCE